MAETLSEELTISVAPQQVYDAVADIKRMARWSPECIGVWVWRREAGHPTRFVGWNRRGPFLWFTTCTVRVAAPGEEFAFDVTTFGLPVARWGYRFSPAEGGTRVTETWQDRRGRGAMLLGRIFTGSSAKMRPEVNREGMRETLRRLKHELES